MFITKNMEAEFVKAIENIYTDVDNNSDHNVKSAFAVMDQCCECNRRLVEVMEQYPRYRAVAHTAEGAVDIQYVDIFHPETIHSLFGNNVSCIPVATAAISDNCDEIITLKEDKTTSLPKYKDLSENNWLATAIKLFNTFPELNGSLPKALLSVLPAYRIYYENNIEEHAVDGNRISATLKNTSTAVGSPLPFNWKRLFKNNKCWDKAMRDYYANGNNTRAADKKGLAAYFETRVRPDLCELTEFGKHLLAIYRKEILNQQD